MREKSSFARRLREAARRQNVTGVLSLEGEEGLAGVALRRATSHKKKVQQSAGRKSWVEEARVLRRRADFFSNQLANDIEVLRRSGLLPDGLVAIAAEGALEDLKACRSFMNSREGRTDHGKAAIAAVLCRARQEFGHRDNLLKDEIHECHQEVIGKLVSQPVSSLFPIEVHSVFALSLPRVCAPCLFVPRLLT